MDNLVSTFADETFSEELAMRVKTLDRLLQSLNYSDHIVGVQNTISISENQTIEDTRGGVEAVLIDAAKSMISEYGVKIENDDMVVIAAVLKVLNNMVEFDDLQMILDNCDQGSPEDTLAFIVETIEGVDATQTLDALDYVLPALIVRIEGTIGDRIRVIETGKVSDEDLDKEALRSDVNAFLAKYPNSKLKQLFDDGFRVGYKLPIYLSSVVEAYGDSIDVMRLSIDFVGCCKAAGVSNVDAEKLAGTMLEPYSKDMHELQTMTMRVRKTIFGEQNETS